MTAASCNLERCNSLFKLLIVNKPQIRRVYMVILWQSHYWFIPRALPKVEEGYDSNFYTFLARRKF